jgi:hypothetical protein
VRELTDVLVDMWREMNWPERCLTFFVQPMLFVIIIVMIAQSMRQEFSAGNRCPTCHQVVE